MIMTMIVRIIIKIGNQCHCEVISRGGILQSLQNNDGCEDLK